MLEKKKFYINGSWVAPKNPKDITAHSSSVEGSVTLNSFGLLGETHSPLI